MAHEHKHIHSNITLNNAFIIGILLNSVFVIIEVITGLYTHSLSLLADAGHNLGDVAGLLLALLASKLALKKANHRYSFGYQQSTVLAAFINACILFISLGAVTYEAILRLAHPQPVEGKIVAIVAGIGILINSLTALMFLKDKDTDLNSKGVYLHMVADAIISLGVVIAGIIIIFTGWYWLDSAVSLILVIVIVFGTWGLFKESLRLTLNGVPKEIDMNSVKQFLLNFDGVTNVHDLHIWAISTTETALTAHLIIPGAEDHDLMYQTIKDGLQLKFKIAHSTIQIECNKEHFDCQQDC
ncbi:MAG: cation diffusion facilitator family transporter [Bacteroidetes bacterium]|nr:cation diffusion facilitator family transporter [Bacteroidota bacterium]